MALAALACGPLALALRSSDRFTLRDLESIQRLTPGDFADLFEYFKFVYSPRVQTADVFLAGQAGDCDDYAILADHVLRQKGYTTRLIQVRMVGLTYDHPKRRSWEGFSCASEGGLARERRWDFQLRRS